MSEHIIYQHGQIWQVNCPCCGTPIRKMIPDDSLSVSERVGGKTVVRERLVLACLPNYQEALLSMDDGSRHVVPMCVECVQDANQEKLETACAADPETLGDRKPVGMLRHAAVILE